MSQSNPPIIPVLFYQDVAQALDWLEDTFNFKRQIVFKDGKDTIVHAEMTYGNIKIMIGPLGLVDWTTTPEKLGGQSTQQLYVYVKDVDAHHDHAKLKGADISSAPEDQFFGDRTYRVADLEGHRWIFGQKMRDVSTSQMAEATGLNIS